MERVECQYDEFFYTLVKLMADGQHVHRFLKPSELTIGYYCGGITRFLKHSNFHYGEQIRKGHINVYRNRMLAKLLTYGHANGI